MNRFVTLMAIFFSAVSALAGEPGSTGGNVTIPDLGPLTSGISVGSAMRQLQANIDDWKDERTKTIPLRDHSCRDADWVRTVYRNGLNPSPVLVVTDPETFAQENFQGVFLTQAERDTLANLRSGGTDPLDQEIRARELAMQVSNRIYSDAIETYHLRAVTAESYAKLDGVEDRCNEYSLRIRRDEVMSAEAQKILDLYGTTGVTP